ncbi:glucoamylase family protein [Sphingomonas aracearum]|nr:glucoamylase family protein [Sphingomonas aracearum]
MISRRSLLVHGSTLTAAAALPRVALAQAPGTNRLPPLFADIERRTFQWFWDTANPQNGLVPDNWPNPDFCSIAAVGFALTAYPVGVARGWITRAQARARTLTTLRFFWNAPQGPAESGVAGYKGFFYHFLHMDTGLRFKDVELSTVDTSLLFGGILFAGQFFGGRHRDEVEIRRLAKAIYERAEWPWFFRGEEALSMGWHPEEGKEFIKKSWTGYNEAMLVYVLGLGSPTHPLPDGTWNAWTATYDKSWHGEGAERHLAFGPMFAHQYSHLWIDFRGIRDAPMREAGFDYFENSRRATYAQRAYAIDNPGKWEGYSGDIWGITASAGPAWAKWQYKGQLCEFRGYSARGPEKQPDGFDDGTLAPTAALGSIAFAPEIVIPAVEAMHGRWGTRIYSRYGFFDAFNPSFRFAEVALAKGSVDPQAGWVSADYLGIDQGPILGGLANHRDGMIWAAMRRSPVIRTGLKRAGFTGGWLGA